MSVEPDKSGESKRKIKTSPAVRRRMHEAARDLRRAATRSEAMLWEALRDRRFRGRKFRRQQPSAGFVVDFFCASERLAIEVDGAVHSERQEADAARQEMIESAGIRFVRVSSEIVESDLPAVLRRIDEVISQGNAPQDSPSPLDGEGARE